jgi:chromatin remodeling complex protein RSC6
MPPRKVQTNQTETKTETKSVESKKMEKSESKKSNKDQKQSTETTSKKNKKYNSVSVMSDLVALIDLLNNEITQMRTDKAKGCSVKCLQNVRKQLESHHKKLQNLMKLKPKRNVTVNSGFNRPVSVSDALCDFLDKPHNSQVSRTEVTKNISTYIKDKNLFKKEKGLIYPDDKLIKLFNSNNPFKWIGQLQKKLSGHFIKSPAVSSSKK